VVEAAMAQVRRFRQVLAQGAIVEQKELLRGFIAGITITPSKDRGIITWYDLSASFSISGGTGDEAEKMQRWASQEAICWGREGWREAA